MTNKFPILWKKLWNLAQDRSSSRSGGGMASFSLMYDPYKCNWTCTVNWSDDKPVYGIGYNEDVAVSECAKNISELLKEEK